MHLLNRLSLTENFHRGPGQRSRAVLINKPILCKRPRQSAKNSHKAFREGEAALALVKAVNLANSNSGTSKLPFSPHFFPPGGLHSFVHDRVIPGPAHSNSIQPGRRSKH